MMSRVLGVQKLAEIAAHDEENKYTSIHLNFKVGLN